MNFLTLFFNKLTLKQIIYKSFDAFKNPSIVMLFILAITSVFIGNFSDVLGISLFILILALQTTIFDLSLPNTRNTTLPYLNKIKLFYKKINILFVFFSSIILISNFINIFIKTSNSQTLSLFEQLNYSFILLTSLFSIITLVNYRAIISFSCNFIKKSLLKNSTKINSFKNFEKFPGTNIIFVDLNLSSADIKGFNLSINKVLNSDKKSGIIFKFFVDDSLENIKEFANDINVDENLIFKYDESEKTNNNLSDALKNSIIYLNFKVEQKKNILSLFRKNKNSVCYAGFDCFYEEISRYSDTSVQILSLENPRNEDFADVTILSNSILSIFNVIKWSRQLIYNLKSYIYFYAISNFTVLFFSIITQIEEKNILNIWSLIWISLIINGPIALALLLDKPSTSNLFISKFKKSPKLFNIKSVLKIFFFCVTNLLILIFILDQKYSDLPDLNILSHSTILSFSLGFLLLASTLYAKSISIFENIHKNIFYIITFIIYSCLQILLLWIIKYQFNVLLPSNNLWKSFFLFTFCLFALNELTNIFFKFFKIFINNSKIN